MMCWNVSHGGEEKSLSVSGLLPAATIIAFQHKSIPKVTWYVYCKLKKALFYIRNECTNIVPVLLNRIQLALAVTFLCQLIKVEMCNQTLASLSAAEINTHILHLQINGQWHASSYHTQTINSINYYFHLT